MTKMVTDRLILREYKEIDRDAYFKLKSDRDTMYYLQDIQLSSQAEADEDFANVLKDMKEQDRKFYFFMLN